MQIFTEQAYSREEAIDLVRRKYGDRAQIHNYKSVRLRGFFGFFTKPGVEVSGFIMEESRRRTPVVDRNLEEEKKKILEMTKKENPMDQVLKEIQDLKRKIETVSVDSDNKHPVFKKIENVLMRNDFSQTYIYGILDKLRASFSYDELSNEDNLWMQIRAWIEADIAVYKPDQEKKQIVYILVGPTGVGKTTTIAKLAAAYSLGDSKQKGKDVRIITIDNFRIGARQQIETYGNLMNVPVSMIENQKDMLKQIQLYRDVDVILIDTVGKSPKDYMQLAEMKELLDGCGISSEAHLAMSATTKALDMDEILSQYEIFKYKSVVLTKVDETSRLGNIISVLKEKNKPISYITDGQTVPVDLHAADTEFFMKRMEGF